MAPTPEDWTAARARYGPHTERYIRVYGYTPGVAPRAAVTRPIPVGTIIAKEKLSAASQKSPEGVAFMRKHLPSAFPESDGWEFLYFPSPPDKKAAQQACASCHQGAAARDYVFGSYPR